MMSRTVPLSVEIIDAIARKSVEDPNVKKEEEERMKNIEPLSSMESEETEEEEIVTMHKSIKASNPVFGMIPPHCNNFLPPRIDPATPKRDLIPTRDIHPEECFDTCPKIVPREQWGASEPLNPLPQLTSRVRPAVFKVTETHECTHKAYCAKCVKFMQTLHMLYRNWDDVAFSFLIGGNGDIFEGRGWGVENEKKQQFCGIAYLGRYKAGDPFEEPTEAMLRSTYDLIMCGVKKGFIKNPFEPGKYHGNTPEEIIRDLIKKEEKVSYMLKGEEIPQLWSHRYPNIRVFRAINFSCLIGVIISLGVIIHSLIDTYEKLYSFG